MRFSLGPWIKLSREVARGARVRRGWKTAWYEPRRRVAVCYPRPLDVAARIAHELAYRIRAAARLPSSEQAAFAALRHEHRERLRNAEVYADGYMAGWHECSDEWISALDSQLENSGKRTAEQMSAEGWGKSYPN